MLYILQNIENQQIKYDFHWYVCVCVCVSATNEEPFQRREEKIPETIE